MVSEQFEKAPCVSVAEDCVVMLTFVMFLSGGKETSTRCVPPAACCPSFSMKRSSGRALWITRREVGKSTPNPFTRARPSFRL